ncbi:iron complex transport system substrate-binding protein [Microbacterium terrae]|uniref:Hemin-binding periplasmic protein HmuT n=1 Tax=Microbacterium terrae TaxID=69369 RepID=A0A0M2HHF1_9MICO|nr:ABC transporter substrate-binding protein [Microbacterium terrae]KJL44203.1 Hemin-binding periplasmic protein HmuT precursor [Microbacterium terrae]MBP1078743.1 iron complex transport system substrate-binding protein [Microbacterium terrae]GLJ98144.1 ABC transporter substrate-binding protein [Microbacterium terrae]
MSSRPLTPGAASRLLAVAALLTASLLAASGCAAASAEPVDADCPAAAESLASVDLVDDPRSAIGPSTACLSSHVITAVDDDTAPSLPVTVTDAEGREVEITDVSRILPVDISGTIAATVFGLGLGDQVVGRDSSTVFDGTEDLPVVTKTGHTLNAEAILELAPTVMLTDTTIGPKEVRQQLREAGIAVVVVSDDRRIDTVDQLVAEVAAALGVPERGAQLADRLTADIEAASAEVDEIAPGTASDRPRMLFLYVRGSANVYYIFGRDSGADSLIEAVDGIDVAGEIGWEGMKPMTAEALVAAQPDVLVMMTDGLASVGGVDGLVERIPALAQTPAGANRRVVDMADADILAFGPRTADVIRALARAVYAPASSPSAADSAPASTPTPTP